MKQIIKLIVLSCIIFFTYSSCQKNDNGAPLTSKGLKVKAISPTFSLTRLAASSGFQLGVNGHPLGTDPYTSTPATTQIKLIKGMNMTWYRFDIISQADGTVTVPDLLSPLLVAAKAGSIHLLPMLYPRTLDLTDDVTTAYQKGKTLGSNFAAQYASTFDYYELGNDLELPLLLPNQTGQSQNDYDLTKFNTTASYLKGMDDGIKAKDPTAQTMIAASWLHYGFIRMCDWYGIKFNIVAYNWYSEMETLAPKAPYNIPDITLKLSALFPTRPIWFTEFNNRSNVSLSRLENETNENQFITGFIAKCKNNPQVKVALVYELFDEPEKSYLEARYGLYKWLTPYTQYVKTICATNLSASD